MKSDDVDVLQQLVNAATGWRTTALTVGVDLNILNTTINGEPVVLSWNTNGYWDVRTS